MGSGCTSNKNAPKCPSPQSSNCVLYQGPPVPALGICTGDTITETESVIITKLLTLLDGTGIQLFNVTLDNCAYLKNLFAGKDKTLSNLMQLLVDSECNLKSLIDQLSIKLQPSNFQYNLGCIPTPATISNEAILQSLITDYCTTKATVAQIQANQGSTTIITNAINSALSSLITSVGNYGLKKSTDASGKSTYQITGMPLPKTALPYFGDLSLFDVSGKGVAGKADGWYLCNGNNGTPDMRGVVPVGAIQGVGGPALSSNVDPSTNADASMNYAVGDTGGIASVTLTTDQIPSHTHSGVDTVGHTHTTDGTHFFVGNNRKGNNVGDGSQVIASDNRSSVGLSTAFVNITIGSTGGGSKHTNRMPYIACAWIMRFD